MGFAVSGSDDGRETEKGESTEIVVVSASGYCETVGTRIGDGVEDIDGSAVRLHPGLLASLVLSCLSGRAVVGF